MTSGHSGRRQPQRFAGSAMLLALPATSGRAESSMSYVPLAGVAGLDGEPLRAVAGEVQLGKRVVGRRAVWRDG